MITFIIQGFIILSEYTQGCTLFTKFIYFSLPFKHPHYQTITHYICVYMVQYTLFTIDGPNIYIYMHTNIYVFIFISDSGWYCILRFVLLSSNKHIVAYGSAIISAHQCQPWDRNWWRAYCPHCLRCDCGIYVYTEWKRIHKLRVRYPFTFRGANEIIRCGRWVEIRNFLWILIELGNLVESSAKNFCASHSFGDSIQLRTAVCGLCYSLARTIFMKYSNWGKPCVCEMCSCIVNGVLMISNIDGFH